MAIYHFSAKVISRGQGRGAIAAASYRAGEKIEQEQPTTSIAAAAYRSGNNLKEFDYSYKKGIIHSEIMLPDIKNPPSWAMDRKQL